MKEKLAADGQISRREGLKLSAAGILAALLPPVVADRDANCLIPYRQTGGVHHGSSDRYTARERRRA